MSVTTLAFTGGLISAITTSLGSLLSPLFSRFERLKDFRLSLDFSLGVMLSAVAFSLVGPELVKGQNMGPTLAGLSIGVGFIYGTHKFIEDRYDSSKILLISALLFHNFPEGMGAGASLAGMPLSDAIPLQVAISIQNVVEGLLLTLLLRGIGLSQTLAVLGGIGSGLIEMGGAMTAGLMVRETMDFLPFLLALAGGAMMESVILEVHTAISVGKKLHGPQFLGGLLVVPFTNLLFS